MLFPFFSSFLVIALAELGDKTQLLTLSFAARYPFWQVIAAVSAATALLMGLAVLFGGVINYYIPSFYLQLITAGLFLFFGFWTLFGKKEDEEGGHRDGLHPFWLVFSTFFLAELGDKTQLGALALSVKYGTPLLVWLGATLGMVAVNLISAVFGGWIKKHLPEVWLKSLAAAAFIIFGLLTLGELYLW